MADPLLPVLLELQRALGDEFPLVLGGGYGLYLKQLHLQANKTPTLFPFDALPVPRATEDIDLFLRAEIATDATEMGRLRAVLDELGFVVIPSARWYQFVRPGPGRGTKIDLLAGPLGPFESRVRPDPRRVKPNPSVELHARRTEEAIGIERSPRPIPLHGQLSDATAHECVVYVPQALPAVLMKLAALRDRKEDPAKDHGRHHALDLFRIIGMLTADEAAVAAGLIDEYDSHPVLVGARADARELFDGANSPGRIRMREHPQFPGWDLIDQFFDELHRLLSDRQPVPTNDATP